MTITAPNPNPADSGDVVARAERWLDDNGLPLTHLVRHAMQIEDLHGDPFGANAFRAALLVAADNRRTELAKLSPYATIIAESIHSAELATVRLVETLLHDRCGVIGDLPGPTIATLANRAMQEARLWEADPAAAGGVTLAAYCRANQIAIPAWADTGDECPRCVGYGWADVPVYDRGAECDPAAGPCPDCDGTGIAPNAV